MPLTACLQLKQRFSGGQQPAAPKGSAAAAAAEEAAAAEARPVEGFSPELQATLAEAKSRIDAETQMVGPGGGGGAGARAGAVAGAVAGAGADAIAS